MSSSMNWTERFCCSERDTAKNTSLHLADARARYPGKHTCTEHSAVLENGKRVWKAYETLFVDGEDFEKIGEDFEKAYSIPTVQLGNAAIRLMNQRDVVDFAVQWIEENRRQNAARRFFSRMTRSVLPLSPAE